VLNSSYLPGFNAVWPGGTGDRIAIFSEIIPSVLGLAEHAAPAALVRHAGATDVSRSWGIPSAELGLSASDAGRLAWRQLAIARLTKLLTIHLP
jgi:hypothetical protein